MPLIKRYPNRKLYDTQAKQYITLQGVAALIRQGEEVQVIDHATGEDLTTLVLMQIIVEQEKARGGLMPRAVLTGLVRAGDDTLSLLRRALASPRDLLRQVDEEIELRLHNLVRRGEMAEEEERRLRSLLLGRTLSLPGRRSPSDAELEEALQARGLPTRDDLRRLTEQLDALAHKLDTLTQVTDGD